jgi:hypothetical protein
LTSQFLLSNPFDKQVQVEIPGFYELNPGGRALQAGKWGGLFFGGAIFCFFLPVVHFFLVPLFLVLSPVMAWRAYFRPYYCPPTTFACPDCGKAMRGENRYVELPYKINCYECGARWTLQPCCSEPGGERQNLSL